MKWALIDANGIISNVIAYDGHAEYTPPDGQALQQVEDDAAIGDAADQQ